MVLLPAIPLLVIIAAFVALGLAATSRQTGAAFASWMNGLGRLGRLVGGVTADLAVSLARWIVHNVGAEWADLQRLAVTWLGGLAQWAEQVIVGALLWPYELSRFAYWLLDVYLPKRLRVIPNTITHTIHQVTTRVVRVERTIVRVPKLSRAVARALVAAAVATFVHPFLADLQWLRRHFSALTHAIPRALPLPTVPAIPNLRKRVARLERLLAAGLGIAVVARALARMRLGWIRCNKVGRLGRAACGLDEGLLESMLTDALAIFGAVSIVEFANGLRAVEDEALGIMGRLVREWPT